MTHPLRIATLATVIMTAAALLFPSHAQALTPWTEGQFVHLDSDPGMILTTLVPGWPGSGPISQVSNAAGESLLLEANGRENNTLYGWPTFAAVDAIGRAAPGAVGVHAGLAYRNGQDYYSVSAAAASAGIFQVDDPQRAGQTVRVWLGAGIHGGLGVFGSDIDASATAFMAYAVNNDPTASGVQLFYDTARNAWNANQVQHLELPSPLTNDIWVWNFYNPGDMRYDYGPRLDPFRVDVPLDVNGHGSLWLEVSLFVSVGEGGEGLPLTFGGTAGYRNTVTAFVQADDNALSLTNANGWAVLPFGAEHPTSLIAPPPLPAVPEPAMAWLMLAGLAVVTSLRRRAR